MTTKQKRFDSDGVIHFSTADNGGAGLGAYRTHKSILRLGFNSHLFVQKKTIDDDTVSMVGAKIINGILSKAVRRFKSSIGYNNEKYHFYDRMNYSLIDTDDILEFLNFTPKVIFIHWTSGFLDTDVIIDLKKQFGSKVYITFMDIAPLTGGCHYSWDCSGYKSECSCCPAVSIFEKNIPKKNMQKKINFVRSVSPIPVSSNSWINKKIRSSQLYGDSEIKEFNIGIDSEVFRPGSKQEARKRLSLPLHKKYILVASSYLSEPRKGIIYAKEAINLLAKKQNILRDNIEILLAGKPGKSKRFLEWALPFHLIGELEKESDLVDLYRSADVFLSTSIEDAGPMMISEAMLCGTPVISFNVGLACDLLKSQESGYLIPSKDYHLLADALHDFFSLKMKSLNDMSRNARMSALSISSQFIQEAKLIELLKDLHRVT